MAKAPVHTRDEVAYVWHRIVLRALLSELEAFVAVARANPWRDVTADEVSRWLPRFRAVDEVLSRAWAEGEPAVVKAAGAYRDAWHALLRLASDHPRVAAAFVEFSRSGGFAEARLRQAEELSA